MANYNVISIDKKSGWIMFFTGSQNGFSQSHNPMDAQRFTATQADFIVEKYIEFLQTVCPTCANDYIVTKIEW